MDSNLTFTSAPGPELRRPATWPPATKDNKTDYISASPLKTTYYDQISVIPPTPHLKPVLPSDMADDDSLSDHPEDLNDTCNPEDLFLSPMHPYEDWNSDSDSDAGSEIEWDAGITDFALFDDDRRRAEEEGSALPTRWDSFMDSQNEALDRAAQRSLRSSSMPDITKPPLPMEFAHGDEEEEGGSDNETPGLTPDTSPNLPDDMEVEAPAALSSKDQNMVPARSQSEPHLIMPRYHTIELLPPLDDERTIQDDEDLPFTFSYRRNNPASTLGTIHTPAKKLPHPRPNFLSETSLSQHQHLRDAKGRLQRPPGLLGTGRRTLSGKLHVWRRPGWGIFSVGEDVEGERRAEEDQEGGWRLGRVM
ncbi:hypothetical protein KC363_g3689 [Hortaea werneckii]|uniref:Uncharacterized protein n=1 Tax=Hortaea werneckii TaxID=91943 RepID=A0A3M7FK25_HORWE|nr:hypothetical protein KC325_g4480 [Hortaea werneckii]KAI6993312.1 hypothetical protein KC359_g5216 [Hortaea werneckii]KAI7145406.1 hypothetical protein KC344_g4501 [Hortaea werneckii]KAI7174148.1 hypothetical protein KC360_g4464 [Hortaea werneckii]KAI7191730.1 hypothetical protein KC363_g3689 [Hortaea werneckii]